MITYERTVDYDKNGNANKVTVKEGVGTDRGQLGY